MEQHEKPFQFPENLDAMSVADLQELEGRLREQLQSLSEALGKDPENAGLQARTYEIDGQLEAVTDMINRKAQPGEK